MHFHNPIQKKKKIEDKNCIFEILGNLNEIHEWKTFVLIVTKIPTEQKTLYNCSQKIHKKIKKKNEDKKTLKNEPKTEVSSHSGNENDCRFGSS